MSLPALSTDADRALQVLATPRVDQSRARAAVTELLRALDRDVSGELTMQIAEPGV